MTQNGVHRDGWMGQGEERRSQRKQTKGGDKKDEEAATNWFNCFCLMAELGLRPIEVNYLQVRFNPIEKIHYWH